VILGFGVRLEVSEISALLWWESTPIERRFAVSPPCDHLGAVKQRAAGDVLALALSPRVRLP